MEINTGATAETEPNRCFDCDAPIPQDAELCPTCAARHERLEREGKPDVWSQAA